MTYMEYILIEDQLINFVVQYRYHYPGHQCWEMYLCSFLSFRNAFDSLDHYLLLDRLHDWGISGIELQWFTDYLSGRMQRVKCGNSYLDWGPVI